MNIKVNGNEIDVDSGISILSLLEQKGINPSTVVVEYNLEIPEREKWGSIKLNNGDKIEIIRFMGGG